MCGYTEFSRYRNVKIAIVHGVIVVLILGVWRIFGMTSGDTHPPVYLRQRTTGLYEIVENVAIFCEETVTATTTHKIINRVRYSVYCRYVSVVLVIITMSIYARRRSNTQRFARYKRVYLYKYIFILFSLRLRAELVMSRYEIRPQGLEIKI